MKQSFNKCSFKVLNVHCIIFTYGSLPPKGQKDRFMSFLLPTCCLWGYELKSQIVPYIVVRNTIIQLGSCDRKTDIPKKQFPSPLMNWTVLGADRTLPCTAEYLLAILRIPDFVAAGASMFHKPMFSWDEISGGNSTRGGGDFRGEILLRGKISGRKFYTGFSGGGGILHWGEISGGNPTLRH